MSYFDKLVELDSLRRGWHLARRQLRQQFVDVYLDYEAFSANFDSNIKELSRSLRTGEYTIDPVYRLNTPKTTFVSRPGTTLSIRNEIVLTAAIALIAENVDKSLSPNVYSWRVTDPPKKDVLFRESDVLALPFLKRGTIRQHVDPFDAWYELWPEFDTKSRATVVEDDSFKHLVVTDISAYFENIELTILEAELLHRSGADSAFIRFIMDHYRAWSRPGFSGHKLGRGIPQSSMASSFLGNLYLAPIDDRIGCLMTEAEIRYYRYMDDVRIFCRSERDAQRCIYEIDDQIRAIGLNIQSAKTDIITGAEILHRLHDSRIDALAEVGELLGSKSKDARPAAISRLKEIGRDPGSSVGSRPIIGGKGPNKGLNLRVLRRWATMCKHAGTWDGYERIVTESLRNPDFRLLNQAIAFARWRPNIRKHARRFLAAFQEETLFAHRRADILRYLRYPAYVPEETREVAWKIFVDRKFEGYLRFQAAMLLMRWPLRDPQIKSAAMTFDATADGWELIARAVCSSQSAKALPYIIEELAGSGSARARDFGRMLGSARADRKFVEQVMRHSFDDQGAHRAIDLSPVIYASLTSDDPTIQLTAAKTVKRNLGKLPSGDWRHTFLRLVNRALEPHTGTVRYKS